MAFFILPLLSARDLDFGPEGFNPRDDISRGLMTSQFLNNSSKILQNINHYQQYKYQPSLTLWYFFIFLLWSIIARGKEYRSFRFSINVKQQNLACLAFTDHAFVPSMFMLSFIFAIVCGRFVLKRICRFFLSFAYVCIAVFKREDWGPRHIFVFGPRQD